jgi:hypothetical protein
MFVIIGCYPMTILVGSLRELDVSGQVIDGMTGVAVPYARVVLIKGQWRWIQHAPTGYAVTANAEGRFRISPGVRRGLGSIWIAGSSPTNEFAMVEYGGEPVILRTGPLKPRFMGRDYMKYDHFTGSSGVLVGGIEFLDDGWEVNPR